MAKITHAPHAHPDPDDFGLSLRAAGKYAIACTHIMPPGNGQGIAPFEHTFILIPEQADNNLFVKLHIPGSTWQFRYATEDEVEEAQHNFVLNSPPQGTA